MAEQLIMERGHSAVRGRKLGAMLVGTLFAIGACGQGETGPRDSIRPTAATAAEPSVSAALLGEPCDTAPIEELPSRVAIVDGRCDADPGAPVGVYPEPHQTGEAVSRVFHGDVLSVACETDGERLQNQNKTANDEWLYVEAVERANPDDLDSADKQFSPGYVPGVWVRTDGDDLPVC